MDNITNQVIEIDRIVEHPDNYNKHPEAQIKSLRESVRTFGQVRSVVLQAPHDTNGAYLCVAGNGVTEAMRREGFTEVKADIVPSDWPPHRVRAYLIADNEQAKGSDPDLEQLAVLARDIQAIEPDLLMALAANADDLLPQQVEPKNAEPQTSRADELREEWGVELGQMWRLPSRTEGQEHRLICGDCTETAVVERVMGGELARMLHADPPYGIGKEIENDNLKGDELLDFHRTWIDIGLSYCIENAYVYAWGYFNTLSDIWQEIIKPRNDCNFRNFVIWQKKNSADALPRWRRTPARTPLAGDVAACVPPPERRHVPCSREAPA